MNRRQPTFGDILVSSAARCEGIRIMVLCPLARDGGYARWFRAQIVGPSTYLGHVELWRTDGALVNVPWTEGTKRSHWDYADG